MEYEPRQCRHGNMQDNCPICEDEAERLQQAKRFLDEAKTPQERNVRKMWLHGHLYGAGPQKLSTLISQFKA